MKKVKAILMSFLVLFALDFDCYQLYLGKYDALLKFGILFGAILFVILFYFFFKYHVFLKNRTVSILSVLFSCFMVLGNSYMRVGNANLVFSNIFTFLLSVLMAIGYYLLFASLLSFLFKWLSRGSFKKEKRSLPLLERFFEKNVFRRSFLVLLLCWLPYIIAFYPIILSPDPSFQIKQFFGIRTKYADYAVLLDENVVLTNHHPVAHTLLLGGCLKIGHTMGNDNFGLFIYSFLQILVLASVLSLTVCYLKKRGISNRYLFFMLLIYALVPMFPVYAMSGVKDVLFTAFVILYSVIVHWILTERCKNFGFLHYGGLILLMLLIILFRNNGLHMLLLSFPFLILAVREKWKELLAVFLITIGLSTGYSKVLLPAFKITPGSIREVLSVPFQQTARYVKYHGDDLTEEEKNTIDTVLGYEDLAERYNPELADPVKNQFNKYTTTEELKDYFVVWFQCFFRHPATYFDATIANTYGYFYPDKQNWYIHYEFDKRILADGFDYHYNGLSGLRDVLSGFALAFPYLPVIGLLSNIAISVWLLFMMSGYLIDQKNYRALNFLLPFLVLVLVCVVSPANAYFRYAMPYVFAMPFLIGGFFSFSVSNLKKKSK